MEIESMVPLMGESYTLMLRNSMQDVLAEIPKDSPNFSLFVDAFYDLMQSKVDPPFEVIWVYAAIKFNSLNSEKVDALDRILAAKDLFQLLSACSSSISTSKSVALLAPVIFLLHGVILELFGSELRLKREKKAMRELKSLVDVILGYISVCCSNISEDEDLNLILDFNDLARFWVNTNDGFEALLPLVRSDVFEWLCGKEFHVGYLAGSVIMEAFFLKLCLFFHLETTPRDELEMNLKSWSVGSITSFQNMYFLEILMRTALETSLPLISMLKPEDEILLRKVLFDAVLLVEYPFLYQNGQYIKSLTLTRLIVTHEAVQHFRELDQKKASSYSRAFSASRLPSQIVKLVTGQNGLEEKADRAKGSSPGALINWLLSLENCGIKVFEEDILKSHAKLGLDISQPEQPIGTLEGKVAGDDGLFYVDNVGEEGKMGEEETKNESVSDVFVAAAQTMKLTDNGIRKRKGKSKEKKVKFVKYDLHQNPIPVKAGTSATNDSSSDESEVEAPKSELETDIYE